MSKSSTIEKLKSMKFTAMAEKFIEQIEDAANYNQLGFEDRMELLVDAEWNRRQANKLSRYIKAAGFAVSNANIEGIEYHEDRHLDKAEILRFATCNYIDEEHHIILMGATGTGKSYIGCALGNAACRKFYKVKYVRMPELLDELKVARGCGEFKKAVRIYKKVDLLVMDEWLIKKLSHTEAYDLLEIIEARSQRGSTIFCTQYEPKGWYSRINTNEEEDSPIADAIMDRIIHNAYQVMICGDISMRDRHGLKKGRF